MNRKIFTLLASVLLLFTALATGNATIGFGYRAAGDPVTKLDPVQNNYGLYHIMVDSVFVGSSGISSLPTQWRDLLYGSTVSATGYVAISGNPNNKWGYGAGTGINGDTLVLAVTESSKLIPISLNDLKVAPNVGYQDLRAALWCVSVGTKLDNENQYEPTYKFRSKSKGSLLKDKAELSGNSDTDEYNWMFSNQFVNNFQRARPLYRDNGDSKYLVVKLNANTAGTTFSFAFETVDRYDFYTGAASLQLLAKFTLIEVAPVVLDAKALTNQLYEGAVSGGVKLNFEPDNIKTASKDYPELWGGQLQFDSLPLMDTNPNKQYVQVTSSNGGVIYNDGWINANGDKFPAFNANSGSSNAYRFVYFPSKDSIVINAKSVNQPTSNSYVSYGTYTDWGSKETANYLAAADAYINTPEFWGLYNYKVYNDLIVRAQDLTDDPDDQDLLTIGWAPANVRISFGYAGCKADSYTNGEDKYECKAADKYVQIGYGLYTIWNTEGEVLGVRIQSGSLSPQWIRLENGECPDRIPSYQWIVENYSSDPCGEKYTITNREFGNLADATDHALKMTNIRLKSEATQIFAAYGAATITQTGFYEPYYKYQYLNDKPTATPPTTTPVGSNTSYTPLYEGYVKGTVLPLLGAGNCGALPTDEGFPASSGFRVVNNEYAKNAYLGYKHFNVGKDTNYPDFGKSEGIGLENSMDYSAYGLQYHHIYNPAEDAYLDLKNNDGHQVFYARRITDPNEKPLSFIFRIATGLRGTYQEEAYGYPLGNAVYSDAGKLNGQTIQGATQAQPSVPRLLRYYYELKVANFVSYLNKFKEQYVVLKGGYKNEVDETNKRRYGVADYYASAEPLKFSNLYFRETFFLPLSNDPYDKDNPKEYRYPTDTKRRIYYAVLDRIESLQKPYVSSMGLELSDEITWDQSTLGSMPGAGYNFLKWEVTDAELDLYARGKTLLSPIVSTFALIKTDYELYRRLNSVRDDDAGKGCIACGSVTNDLDAPKVLRIHQDYHYGNENKYLYEDGNSAKSQNFGPNYLGENLITSYPDSAWTDGEFYNYSLFIDTAFVNRGTGPIKPQYLIAVDPECFNYTFTQKILLSAAVPPTVTQVPDGCGGYTTSSTGGSPEKTTEIKYKPYIKARYLINATDSAHKLGSNGTNNYPVITGGERYMINSTWDRLVFTDAIHVDDKLYILGRINGWQNTIHHVDTVINGVKIEGDFISIDELSKLSHTARTFTGTNRPPDNSAYTGTTAYATYYDLGYWDNFHNDVTFSLRFNQYDPNAKYPYLPIAKNADVGSGLGGSSNDEKTFWIESETYARTPYGNPKIAPMQGGWLMSQNGAVVISRGTYEQSIDQATLYNIDKTEIHIPTANETISSASSVKVIAGKGEVAILNAAGKKLTVTNILGQRVAETVLSSDNATVKVPSGIAIVSVEGEKTVKSVIK